MLKIYSIYDEKALTYNTPFFALNDNVAKRMFCSLCDDVNSMVYKYPDDFKLYYLGDFDETTADLVVNPTRVWLMNGHRNELEYKNPEIID